MLTAFLLLAALAQDAPPAPFLWSIEGLWDPQPTLLVTITPTPLGRVSGLDIQSIAIEPVPTPDDPHPASVHPTKTERTTWSGLQSSFTKPGRRFTLNVTLSDGSTHKIDPWAARHAEPIKAYPAGPLQLIAPRGSWGD